MTDLDPFPQGCAFGEKCSSRAEMQARHGTPAEFAQALSQARDLISLEEAEAALRHYEKLWMAGSCTEAGP